MKKIFLMAVALCSFAMVSAQSASEVTAKYNDAVAAYSAKNWSAALEGFESVIKGGQDSEDGAVLGLVATAKKSIPTCYRMLGTRAAGTKNWDEAIKYLTASAEKAELWGDTTAKQKANQILAKVYQVQGGEAFNAKDYATAASVFEKGYAANPRNAEMALNLATSYCELGKYDEGMAIYDKICKMPAEKYADAIAKATANKTLYTNNKVASLQQAGDFDGVIAMADKLAASAPALAEKIRIEAYNGKKDYAQVIALGEAAAAAQANEEDKSAIYFLVGAAYNAQYNAGGNKDVSLRDKAIATLKKVVAGDKMEAAKAALAELAK